MKNPGAVRIEKARSIVKKYGGLFKPRFVPQILNVLDVDWWLHFCGAVQSNLILNIRPINNDGIVHEVNGKYVLKEKLIEELDFLHIAHEDFSILEDWIGVELEARDILRRFAVRTYANENKIYSYPVYLKVADYDHQDSIKQLEIVGCENIRQVKEKALEVLGFKTTPKGALLLYDNDAPDECKSADSVWYNLFNPEKVIYVNISDSRCITPRSESSSMSSSMNLCLFGSSQTASRFYDINMTDLNDVEYVDGFVDDSSHKSTSTQIKPVPICSAELNSSVNFSGLANSTTTMCFLNSAVQCLSHIDEIKSYFLSRRFRRDLAAKRTSSSSTEVLESYVDLLKHIWLGRGVVDPMEFFKTVSRHAPQFRVGQHDSQELLSYLLNNFHEILSGSSETDFAGCSERHSAQQIWNEFIRRNESIVSDKMYGLLKSSTKCMKCSKMNAKFEPFSLITLPLEVKCKVDVIFIPSMPNEDWRMYSVTISENTVVADVKRTMKCRDSKILFFASVEGEIISLLRDDDNILSSSPINTFIAAQVELSDATSDNRIIIVRNRVLDGQELMTLPIFYTVPSSHIVDLNYIRQEIHSHIRKYFMQPHPVQPIGPSSRNANTAAESKNCLENCAPASGTSVTSDNNCDQTGLNDFTNSNPVTDYDYQLTYNSGYNESDQHCFLAENENMSFPTADEHNLRVVSLTFTWKFNTFVVKRREEMCKVTSIDLTSSSADGVLNLLNLFEHYLKEESLLSHNKMFCSNCGGTQLTVKKIDLCKLPNIFIVHLGRFQNRGAFTRKLSHFVDIPVRSFDLSSTIVEESNSNCKYDLISVIHHNGSISCGHYWAWTLSDNSWFECNDSIVRTIPHFLEPLKSQSAYILIYRRSNT